MKTFKRLVETTVRSLFATPTGITGEVYIPEQQIDDDHMFVEGQRVRLCNLSPEDIGRKVRVTITVEPV